MFLLLSRQPIRSEIRWAPGVSHHSFAVSGEQLAPGWRRAPKSAAALVSQGYHNCNHYRYVCMTSEQVGIKSDRKLTSMHCVRIAGHRFYAELAHLKRALCEGRQGSWHCWCSLLKRNNQKYLDCHIWLNSFSNNNSSSVHFTFVQMGVVLNI